MTLKTLDCVACGESVPYGRLSCPACGALLASVSGARSPVVATPVPPRPSTAPAPPRPTPVVAEVAVQAHVRSRPKTSPRRRAADAAPAEPALDRAFAPLAARSFVEDPSPASPWAPLQEPEPVLTARPYQRHLAPEHDAPAATTTFPGAYRRSTMAGAAAAAFADVATVIPAREALRSAALSGQARVASEARGAVGSMRGLVDAAALVEIAAWFVIVGAAMSVLGFLLPWSVAVIGASGSGGYFNGWGLASPTHVLIFAGLLGVLALGVVRTTIPAWLRSGVLGLVSGGLLVGLAWPYLVGRLGADVGVIVTALGGVALVIGGIVASWATRHAEPEALA